MLARFVLLGLTILFGACSAPFGESASAADDKKAEAKVTFDGNVKPILAKRCGKCHNAERPRGELDLSNYGAVMLGGVSGKAVVAGKSDASPLYTMAAHLEDPKMPPNSPKIPQTELDTIRNWIADGLIEQPGGTATTATTVTPPPKNLDGLGTAAVLSRPTPVTALAVSPKDPLVAVAGKKQVLLYDLPAN